MQSGPARSPLQSKRAPLVERKVLPRQNWQSATRVNGCLSSAALRNRLLHCWPFEVCANYSGGGNLPVLGYLGVYVGLFDPGA